MRGVGDIESALSALSSAGERGGGGGGASTNNPQRLRAELERAIVVQRVLLGACLALFLAWGGYLGHALGPYFSSESCQCHASVALGASAVPLHGCVDTSGAKGGNKTQWDHLTPLMTHRKLNLGPMTGVGQLLHLFTTPIAVFNLHAEFKDFNKRLGETAAAAYEKFEPRRSVFDPEDEEARIAANADLRARNDRFFAWQQAQTGLKPSDREQLFEDWYSGEDWGKLREILHTAAKHYLHQIGEPQSTINNRQDVFIWASVHANLSLHNQHSHPSSLMSGVYYPEVHRDSAFLEFDDPRGPRWPFDTKTTVRPGRGCITLFPPWVLHTVHPTPSHRNRISYAFNLAGSWGELTLTHLFGPTNMTMYAR